MRINGPLSKNIVSRCSVVAAGIALALFATPGVARAQAAVLIGSMANFDGFNDTGQVAHGFEAEVDGVSGTVSSFPSRYGFGNSIPFAGGVYLRYTSTYVNGQWTAGTPLVGASFTPSNGEQCITAGQPNPTMPCDHFGVRPALGQNPTRVLYYWLVENPANPGTLIRSSVPLSIPQ